MMKNKPKIVAVVCVRMGSARLAGKVMLEILGKPVLGYLIERAKSCALIDEIVITTSVAPQNDTIADYCRRTGVNCYRGSEDDVLGRMLGALKSQNADVGVEIFGDGPLIDPEIIDSIISFYLGHAEEYDFVSNDLKTTYPCGMELEVFSLKALEDAAQERVPAEAREHGTLFIRQHPERYRLYNIAAPLQLFYPGISVELDTKEDFVIIKNIIENLYPAKPGFTVYDVIEFLKNHPELTEINKQVERRWKKYRKDEI